MWNGCQPVISHLQLTKYFNLYHSGPIPCDSSNWRYLQRTMDMLLQVKTSEPRDALQLERTCLSLVRFSTTLFVTSFGIHLNFKLNTSNNPDSDSRLQDPFLNSVMSQWLSYLLVTLLFVFLLVTGASYYVTINRYKVGNINNFGFNNSMNSLVMGVLILALLCLNILLLIDGYIVK